MSKQTKRSIMGAVPYVVVLALVLGMALFSYGGDPYDVTKVSSRVVYGRKIGNMMIYEYLICNTTTTWFSDQIPLNGAKRVSMTIFEDQGEAAADWTGTVGTGDFYLKGKVGIGDSDISGPTSMITLPYVYGPKGSITAGNFIRGTTAIDLYGRTFYNLEELGPLTHIQANVTTNNVTNTVQIAVEK